MARHPVIRGVHIPRIDLINRYFLRIERLWDLHRANWRHGGAPAASAPAGLYGIGNQDCRIPRRSKQKFRRARLQGRKGTGEIGKPPLDSSETRRKVRSRTSGSGYLGVYPQPFLGSLPIAVFDFSRNPPKGVHAIPQFWNSLEQPRMPTTEELEKEVQR